MFANALRTTVARSAARQTIGMRYASTVAAKPQGNVVSTPSPTVCEQ